jgi:ribonuclease HI
MALRFLLKCALENNVKCIKIFGDSNLIINLMKGRVQLHNIMCGQIGDQLKEVADSFESILFTHVLQELNEDADSISKEVNY